MRKNWEPSWEEGVGWKVEFWIEGHRIRRRLGIRDRSLKDVARNKAKRLYKEAWKRHLDPVASKPGTPFSKAAVLYIEGGGEARFLPPLMRHFGPDTVIEEIDEAKIVEAGTALYPGRAADTIRRQVRVPISAVIRAAKGQQRRASTDTRRTRWLTPEEAERLLDAAAALTLPRHTTPEHFTLAKIAALLGSGMRTGECFAAEVQHWNANTRQLWLPAELEGAGKSSAAARYVRLPTRAVSLLGDLPEVGRMFRTPYGRPIKLRANGGGQMQTSFKKAREAAKLGSEVTPHVLRHTWATWYYAQTKDFGGLMDLGGWAKPEMANRYRKLAPDDLSKRLFAHGWDFRTDPDARGAQLRTFNRDRA